MNAPARERTDDYLAGLDTADEWTPETVYDPRPFRLWWYGLMTYDEYQAHKAKMDAFRAEHAKRVNEDVERIMAAMGW